MKSFIQRFLILIALFGSLLSCNTESEQNETFIQSSIDPAVTKSFKTSTPTRSLSPYETHLDISRVQSNFNVKTSKLNVVTPVPNGNFTVNNLYYYKAEFVTVVIMHITDGTPNPAKFPINKNTQTIEGSVDFKLIKARDGSNTPFNPKKSDIVVVVVYNDDQPLVFKEIMRPEESGGGVIVGKP